MEAQQMFAIKDKEAVKD